LGIIALVICIVLQPSLAVATLNQTIVIEKSNNFINNGNILYVGGTGEGNYTSIQDAIDNASNGDTVYVFDDSSPYYENVVVNKSINLLGENKDTTVIDGYMHDHAIYVCLDYVNISRFTIINGMTSGIYVFSNHNTIMCNIIINSSCGIFLTEASYNYIWDNYIYNNTVGIVTFYSGCTYNIFLENNLFNNIGGICLTESSHCKIVDNKIKYDNSTSLSMGIMLQEFSTNNEIIGNLVSDYEFGIAMCSSINTKISGNNINSNRRFGLYLQHCSVNNKITYNNFINNGYEKSYKFRGNAFFIDSEFIPYSNIWNENYWDDWIGLKYKLLTFLPYRIPGRWGIIRGIGILFPTSDFDLSPAKEPYDI